MNPESYDGWALETLAPDLVRVRWTGPLTGAALDGARAYSNALRAEFGHELIRAIVLVGEDADIDKRARKDLLEASRDPFWNGTAIVGGPRRVRVLVELVINAIELITKKATPVTFVNDEAEGVAWLAGPKSGKVISPS